MHEWPDGERELRVRSQPRERAGPLLDLASVLVLAALVGWVVLPRRPGDAIALASLLVLAGAVYGASRLLTGLHGALVPAFVVLCGIALAVVRADVLLASPVPSPLGYSNATGAFYLLVSGAAIVVAVRVVSPTVQATAWACAMGAALVPWLNGATTAAVLTVVPPLALLARPLGRRIRGVVALGGVLAIVALAVPIVLSLTFTGDGTVDHVVTASLSARRPQLWGDAVAMIRSAPLLGVGPGRFAEVSPTALADADAAWAHHAYLQLAAETGLVGGLLAVALLVCLLARMWAGPRDPGTGVLALATAALSVTASVDYVLHFAPVVLAAAALAGAALDRRSGQH